MKTKKELYEEIMSLLHNLEDMTDYENEDLAEIIDKMQNLNL